MNARVLISPGLADLKPQDILDLVVYKAANAPAQWRSLAAHGIIALTVSRRLVPAASSLPALRRQLNLKGPCRFEVEGQWLQDPSLRIAAKAIASIEVRPGATGTVVAIRLVPAAARSARPGVYIRGVVGRPVAPGGPAPRG